MYIHHYKRHFNSVASYLIYALLIAYFTFSGLQLSATELAALAVNVAVVDDAENAISQQYIDALRQYDIVKLQLTDAASADRLLAREIVDLIIVIPPDYDPNDADNKLGYYYLSSNVIAPATLDLLAIDLLPHIAKQRLVNAAARYQVGDAATAKTRFSDYLKTLNGNFDVAVLAIDEAAELGNERALIIVENAKNTLLFALFSIVLIAILPLALKLNDDAVIGRRIALTKDSIAKYFRNQRTVSYCYIFILWAAATLSVGSALQLTTRQIISLLLSGYFILVFYYELLRLLMGRQNQNYLTSLLALTAIILPAIIGGVFFASDLLPAQFASVTQFLPFNLLERIFYQVLETGWAGKNSPLLIALYCLIGAALLMLNLQLRRLQIKKG